MPADSQRWHVVEQPVHAAEGAALDHVRELLPDVDPCQGWTNFNFHIVIACGGAPWSSDEGWLRPRPRYFWSGVRWRPGPAVLARHATG